jgi:hypothetical protein
MNMQFNHIPPEFLSRDSLYKYFNPSDSVIWWKTGSVDMDTGIQEVLYCSNNKDTILLPPFNSFNTYNSVYFNAFLYNSYLVYKTKSNSIRYIGKAEEIPIFLGTIDNLGEALFLVSLYGYVPFKDISTYSFNCDVYELKLYKIISPPDLSHIEIDNKGRPVDRIPNLSRIKVFTNGDVYEFIEDRKVYRKLELNEMHRPL